MPDLKIPTPGRIVSFFPNGMEMNGKNLNTATVLPAVVVQSWEGSHTLNMSVLLPDQLNPVMFMLSVSHKTYKTDGAAYWDWPEIK